MPQFMAVNWDTIRPYRGWMIAAAVIVLLVAVGVVLAVRMVRRHRYDKALEEEMKADAARVAPSALTAEITVIPQEELPSDGNRLFMPVPATVSDMVDFVSEGRDGVVVRSCIRREDAEGMITDQQAENLKAVIYRDLPRTDAVAYVSVSVLSANFAPHSYVNLAILKQNGFVADGIEALSVREGEVMRKPLMIEAHEFSPAAVKMISLVGGRALEVKRQ